MERQELQKAYNQYIEELARDALARKPVNLELVRIVTQIQKDMRDIDIVESMKRQMGSTNTMNEIHLNPEPIPMDDEFVETTVIQPEEDFSARGK